MTANNKIIFVNRFFYPDHSATSQMLSDLAFALAKRGWNITVITSRQRYDDPSALLPPSEVINGVEVRRIWTSRFGRSNVAGRAVDYASFYASASTALLRLARRGNIVVAKTDPPMLSLIACPICTLRGAKSINWLQDIFPEVAAVLGLGRGGRAIMSVATIFRDWSLRSADCNVAIGTLMADRLKALGVTDNQIRIIPNWSDGARIKPIPAPENSLRKEWGLEGKFVVAYSGNLGRAHEIDTILNAMECTHKEHRGSLEPSASAAPIEATDGYFKQQPDADADRIVWLFIGSGALMTPLQRAVNEAGYENVVFKPYQPREMIAESLSTGDVHLVCLRPDLEGLIVPSKYYGIAAVGKPAIFIGADDGEIASVLKESGAGITVKTGDGKSLADALRRYMSDRELVRRTGANARRIFEDEYDFPVSVAKWEGVIKAFSQPRKEQRECG